MAGLNERPPVTIRANTLRISRDDLRPVSATRSWPIPIPRALAPEGLTVRRGGIGRWAAFAAGWCAIQDEASMLIARLLGPAAGRDGRRRLRRARDQDHAPGASSWAIAAGSSPWTRTRAGSGSCPAACARLGVSIVEAARGRRAPRVAERPRGRCDRVLVDAPCSNLGVLRRNPDVQVAARGGRRSAGSPTSSGASSSRRGRAREARRASWSTRPARSSPRRTRRSWRAFLDEHRRPACGSARPPSRRAGPDGVTAAAPRPRDDGFTAMRLIRLRRA